MCYQVEPNETAKCTCFEVKWVSLYCPLQKLVRAQKVRFCIYFRLSPFQMEARSWRCLKLKMMIILNLYLLWTFLAIVHNCMDIVGASAYSDVLTVPFKNLPKAGCLFFLGQRPIMSCQIFSRYDADFFGELKLIWTKIASSTECLDHTR